MASALPAASPVTSDHPAADLELAQVRSAIDLITSGTARRVTLVGLRGAERLLPRAQVLAADAGLTARAVRHGDGTGCDIAVEPIR
jgi:hypothetical protein